MIYSRALPLELFALGFLVNDLALFAALNDSFGSTATNPRKCCLRYQKPAGWEARKPASA